MSEGFRGVPGVPEGWELERIGQPVYKVDHIVDQDGNPKLCDFDSSYLNRVIIRKIEQPARYRPFANAEEFKPHRDRWWSWKDDRSNTFPPAAFGKSGHHSHSWEASFDRKVFDDGTPFGVKIDE